MPDFGFGGRKVRTDQFSMVPRPDVPRSTFRSQHTHKTTFDSDYLVPVYVDEILPGDSLSVDMTAFVRMSTPLFPVMDNLHLDTFFFFVPNRLVWIHWTAFMGEENWQPESPPDYLIPQIVVPGAAGYQVGSLADYMGIPTADQANGGFSHNALPMRAYDMIYDEWFRDQNLMPISDSSWDNGPDDPDWYVLRKRGKRHDYFTSSLPWPQKGETVTLPLGSRAPVRGIGVTLHQASALGTQQVYEDASGDSVTYQHWTTQGDPTGQEIAIEMNAAGDPSYPGIYADLSEAVAANINIVRQAFAVQQLMERDARGGTRYTEILQSHFGVTPQDARLQRPEYLGGGSTMINVTPVAQTSATGLTGGTSPLGGLGGVGMTTARHGFSQSFTEHGYVIGLVNVRADLTYQQGLARHWSRRTRFDYYWPAFAFLGEQAVLRQEIFLTSVEEDNQLVFGYQERWAELRHKPSRISGRFRSGVTSTMDNWHLAQEFETAPVLSEAFIVEDVPMERVLAAGSLATAQQFLGDFLFNCRHTRPMPMYSVPGLQRL